MSLNTAHANGGVLIYSGEWIMLYCDDVELHFEGGDSAAFKGSKKGRIYLTSHRMVFTNKDGRDAMQSFSFPFLTMTSIELEQPVFGANYIKGKVKAQNGGNWTGTAKFKLHFKSGGAIEYGQAMLEAAKMASRNVTNEPPPYTPPMGPFYQAPPPAYSPPAGGYYGFVPPTHVFPNAPPPGSVFMTDQPPPYPGINSGYDATYPPMANGASAGVAPQPMSSADLKAQEAAQSAQSAYYNPQEPHLAYMPPPPGYNQGPPSYAEATKKYQ